jgi:hypothetical protein
VAKTLDDLREHLFATLDALRDKDKPMEIERAKAISEVAAAVIDSAKAEVAYVKATGRDDLSLPVFNALPDKSQAGTPEKPRMVTHRIK